MFISFVKFVESNLNYDRDVAFLNSIYFNKYELIPNQFKRVVKGD